MGGVWLPWTWLHHLSSGICALRSVGYQARIKKNKVSTLKISHFIIKWKCNHCEREVFFPCLNKTFFSPYFTYYFEKGLAFVPRYVFGHTSLFGQMQIMLNVMLGLQVKFFKSYAMNIFLKY